MLHRIFLNSMIMDPIIHVLSKLEEYFQFQHQYKKLLIYLQKEEDYADGASSTDKVAVEICRVEPN